MMTVLYGVLLMISIMVIFYVIHRDYENFDVQSWSLVLLVPLVVLGYMLKTMVTTEEAARLAFCYIYLDSTVVLVLMIFCVLRFMRIHISPLIKIGAYLLAFIQLVVVWLNFNTPLYYETINLTDTGLGTATRMTYGPLRVIHWVYMLVIVSVVVIVSMLAFMRRGSYSKRTMLAYTLSVGLGIFVYASEYIFDLNFSLLPILYVAADVLIVANYDITYTHNISNLIVEQQRNMGTVGYVAMDLDGRYLGCNEKAYDYVPDLVDQVIDVRLKEKDKVADTLYGLITEYQRKGNKYKDMERGDRTVRVEISEYNVSKNSKVSGYLFSLRDVTEEQRIMQLTKNYNDTLNAEVSKKTANIKRIQQRVVLGLANMIENRDYNTGGHVKRTSDIIHILVDEVKRQEVFGIESVFAEDIVRAAPMHDLGKITIENSILCKPDKLTDEEFEIMKSHAAKSGEFVKIILQGVEEKHFLDVAFNVARYHHERWDGRGYPEGLVGTMIPLEARIMAVADVYDALMSKRHYKESMDAAEVADIMIRGMGSQFDPNMLSVFLGCRAQLEEYYHGN